MAIVPGPGAEFANFGDHDLLMGLTSGEAWLDLTNDDLQVRLERLNKSHIACGRSIDAPAWILIIGAIR